MKHFITAGLFLILPGFALAAAGSLPRDSHAKWVNEWSSHKI